MRKLGVSMAKQYLVFLSLFTLEVPLLLGRSVLAVCRPLLLHVVSVVEDQSELVFLEEGLIVEVIGLRFGVVDELRAEQRIEGQPEHIFKHPGDQSFERVRGQLEARVGVDLDQKGPEARIYQKVQPKELEAVVFAVGVEFVEGRADDLEGDVPHGLMEAVDAVLLPAELAGEVAFELSVAQFVSLLVLAVLLAVLLNGVVGQVDEPVAEVLEVVGAARGPNVTLLVEVKLESAVDVQREQVGANIELPAVVQEGVFNVLLNDQLLLARQPRLHLAQRPGQSDPLPSIGILAWLQDPKAVLVFVRGELLLKLLCGAGVIELQVVGNGNYLPEVALGEPVVAVQIEEQGVFVADQIVELEVVVIQVGLRYALQTHPLLASSNWLIVSLALPLVKQKAKGLRAYLVLRFLL